MTHELSQLSRIEGLVRHLIDSLAIKEQQDRIEQLLINLGGITQEQVDKIALDFGEQIRLLREAKEKANG